MSHLDEGTLHALLDGELELHDLREIQAHLGSCAACDSRLRSAKEVFREADRLVGTVQFPGQMRTVMGGSREPPLPPPDVAEEPEDERGASPPAARRELRIEQPVYDDLPPVFLPEDNQWPERRRKWLGRTKWAALLFVAVGAGYIASNSRQSPASVYSEPERPRLMRSPEAVVSPEEAGGEADATLDARADTPAESRAEVEPPRSRPDPAASERFARKAAPASPRPEAQVPANAAEQVQSEEPAAATGAADAPPEDEFSSDAALEDAVSPNVREEAAAALAELDRQRRRDRAAAATAAIDRRQPAPVAAQSAPPLPPAPRTLEQRSGIYLRIGLDEAARQLGRPVHVIEGLNAQFMGLVQGRQAPGADDARPAVRVVYQDSQNRMILLDQQRVRPGQSWPSGATQWVVGEIGLALHGEAGPEVLRNLRPRVR